MNDHPVDATRVALLDPPTRAGSEHRTAHVFPPDDDPDPATLLELLQEVATSIRAGDYASSDPEGVLADVVVGNRRCVLLVHRPTLVVQLSPREQEIARMVASGRTNHAIAGALDISVWTVSTHLRRIFAKLAVGSRAEMVARLLGQRDAEAAQDHLSSRMSPFPDLVAHADPGRSPTTRRRVE